MVYVANPLYDAVFKYLMEDERIAKTILSALLQKEVLEERCAATNTATSIAMPFPCSESTLPPR